jgi:hypothetical protein
MLEILRVMEFHIDANIPPVNSCACWYGERRPRVRHARLERVQVGINSGREGQARQIR